MYALKRITISGFKSIRHAELELGRLNLFLGANGSGKSNFIAFFKLLKAVAAGGLQAYVSRYGGANSILHYGSKQTPEIVATLTYSMRGGEYSYRIRLSDAAPDTLTFIEEDVTLLREGAPAPVVVAEGGPGRGESMIWDMRNIPDPPPVWYGGVFRDIGVYQFHDTSESSPIRKSGYIQDNGQLRSDAGNLAAFLYAMRHKAPLAYERITSVVRQIFPSFGDFVLDPATLNPNMILLNWRERGSDYLFGPHQLPDGLLRFMAMATLLLQPEASLPKLIIIDEPELGLHPAALVLLSALVREVSDSRQVILATQSSTMVDQFDLEDIVIVERVRKGEQFRSEFKRLDRPRLENWLQDYGLGELWMKNLLGGRP